VKGRKRTLVTQPGRTGVQIDLGAKRVEVLFNSVDATGGSVATDGPAEEFASEVVASP
jgi:hypothetical protein